MTYDKKTGTISTDGDRKQFEKDLASHMAYVEAQVELELRNRRMPWKLLKRLNELRRGTKIIIVSFVVWTLYVTFRTADNYEVLGFDLDRWDDDYFLVNWLLVPFVAFVLYHAIRWALTDKSGSESK